MGEGILCEEGGRGTGGKSQTTRAGSPRGREHFCLAPNPHFKDSVWMRKVRMILFIGHQRTKVLFSNQFIVFQLGLLSILKRPSLFPLAEVDSCT